MKNVDLRGYGLWLQPWLRGMGLVMVLIMGSAWLGATAHAQNPADLPAELTACGDEGEFPPFSYFIRRDGVRSEEVGGYSVDFVSALSRLSGRPIKLRMLPWARCLWLAENGEVDFVIDTASNPERTAVFSLVGPYYQINGAGYLYRKGYEAPLPRDAQEFSRQRICIPLGYSFQRMGDSRGANVQRPATYGQTFKMLRAGRCDFVPVILQVLHAGRSLGIEDPRQAGDVLFQTADWVPTVDMYFSVSKKSPQHEAVVRFLDQWVRNLKASGETIRLLRAYGMSN